MLSLKFLYLEIYIPETWDRDGIIIEEKVYGNNRN